MAKIGDKIRIIHMEGETGYVQEHLAEYRKALLPKKV